MLVIVAPGQGAQTPGFLTPWLEDPVFASRMEWLSTVAGLDLAHYGTEADADTIRDTQIAQPLLVATRSSPRSSCSPTPPTPTAWSAPWPATASASSPPPRAPG